MQFVMYRLFVTDRINPNQQNCLDSKLSVAHVVSTSIFPLLLSDSKTKLKTLKCSKVADGLYFLHRVLVCFELNLNACFDHLYPYSRNQLSFIKWI